MRLGDWVIGVSMTLNVCALVAYAWQGHWPNALYWFGALTLNTAILWGMR